MISSLLDGVAGDPIVEKLFSASADIDATLAFEAALAHAQAALGVIPQEASFAISAACQKFVPDMRSLEAGMVKDGVVVPSLIAALRNVVGEPHGKWLHWGATSQDAVDSSLTLRLKRVCDELDSRLSALIAMLDSLRERDGGTQLMAHTRMQRAMPFTAADKIDTWRHPLIRDRERLAEIRPRLLVVQFGGAVGTRDGLDGKGDAIAEKLAGQLGLGMAPVWHTARDGIIEFGGWLSLVSGTLGKIGADVAIMAQNEVSAVQISGGGQSSVMAHKSNPVAAELLMALGRFNAGLVGTLHQSLIHENERSGSAWTLEWLVLPQSAVATGAALRHAAALIENMTFKPDGGVH
jgi:3-carboxy-cis,cis-muconate cycloisomerase